MNRRNKKKPEKAADACVERTMEGEAKTLERALKANKEIAKPGKKPKPGETHRYAESAVGEVKVERLRTKLW